jgi:hypothetical protein
VLLVEIKNPKCGHETHVLGSNVHSTPTQSIVENRCMAEVVLVR